VGAVPGRARHPVPADERRSCTTGSAASHRSSRFPAAGHHVMLDQPIALPPTVIGHSMGGFVTLRWRPPRRSGPRTGWPAGPMWSHQRECAAPPWTSTIPGLPGRPQARYAIGVPSTFTRARSASVASAAVNQPGGSAGAASAGDVMSNSEPDTPGSYAIGWGRHATDGASRNVASLDHRAKRASPLFMLSGLELNCPMRRRNSSPQSAQSGADDADAFAAPTRCHLPPRHHF